MNKILRVNIIQADIHTIYLYIRRNINYFTECYYDLQYIHYIYSLDKVSNCLICSFMRKVN